MTRRFIFSFLALSMLALPSLSMASTPTCQGSMFYSPSEGKCINGAVILQKPQVVMSRLYDGKIIALGTNYGTAHLELSDNGYFTDTVIYGESGSFTYHEITLPVNYKGYARIAINMNNTVVYGYPIIIK